MAPATSDKEKSLNADQVKLLCEVMTQAKVALTPAQWTDIASTLGISNGKAAKERFRYLMNSLSGVPNKAAKSDTKETPKIAPATPTSITKTPTKKRKKIDEEGDDDADQAVNSPTPKKTPRSKKAKVEKAPTTPETDDVLEDPDDRKPKKDKAGPANWYDGTSEAQTTPKKEDDQDENNHEANENEANDNGPDDPDQESDSVPMLGGDFGAIGGGEESMFPAHGDDFGWHFLN